MVNNSRSPNNRLVRPRDLQRIACAHLAKSQREVRLDGVRANNGEQEKETGCHLKCTLRQDKELSINILRCDRQASPDKISPGVLASAYNRLARYRSDKGNDPVFYPARDPQDPSRTPKIILQETEIFRKNRLSVDKIDCRSTSFSLSNDRWLRRSVDMRLSKQTTTRWR